jgi:ribosomal protein S18 acetylase RimI-like enzyme
LRPEEVDDVAEVLGLARLNQGDGSYLVAWGGGAPVGHVHVAATNPPQLQDLEVRASHRRLGVATALISAAEDEARAQGFDEICLEVSVGDAMVQALYRNRGFRDAGSPIRRVKGRVILRTGPIEVDDELLLLSKRLRP